MRNSIFTFVLCIMQMPGIASNIDRADKYLHDNVVIDFYKQMNDVRCIAEFHSILVSDTIHSANDIFALSELISNTTEDSLSLSKTRIFRRNTLYELNKAQSQCDSSWNIIGSKEEYQNGVSVTLIYERFYEMAREDEINSDINHYLLEIFSRYDVINRDDKINLTNSFFFYLSQSKRSEEDAPLFNDIENVCKGRIKEQN